MIDDGKFVRQGCISVVPGWDVVRSGGILSQGMQGEHGVQRPLGDHHAFQKGVGSQPVGAVKTGAAGFPCGVKAVQAGLAVDVRQHAAALEMRCGNNGNGFPGGIDAVAVACLVNQGKTFLDEPFRLVGDIQINAHAARPLHFRIYGAGGDVARGQGFAGVVLVHEFLPVRAYQHAAFPAHGFGDEEGARFRAFRAGVEETGGMELHEFHVGDGGPRPPGHGYAVPRGGIIIGSVQIYAPAAAGGEQHAV